MKSMAFKRIKKGLKSTGRVASDAFKKDFARRKQLRQIESEARFQEAKRQAAIRGKRKAREKAKNPTIKRITRRIARPSTTDINKLIGG